MRDRVLRALRFEGVETSEVAAAEAGRIAMTGCSAYLVCSTCSRMDADDHVLVCGLAL